MISTAIKTLRTVNLADLEDDEVRDSCLKAINVIADEYGFSPSVNSSIADLACEQCAKLSPSQFIVESEKLSRKLYAKASVSNDRSAHDYLTELIHDMNADEKDDRLPAYLHLYFSISDQRKKHLYGAIFKAILGKWLEQFHIPYDICKSPEDYIVPNIDAAEGCILYSQRTLRERFRTTIHNRKRHNYTTYLCTMDTNISCGDIRELTANGITLVTVENIQGAMTYDDLAATLRKTIALP